MVCDQNHICKSCGYHRRLKLMEPCSDCFHNQKFYPVSGTGKCCWILKKKSDGILKTDNLIIVCYSGHKYEESI